MFSFTAKESLPSWEEAARCQHCSNVDASKGRDMLGHIHCRKCPAEVFAGPDTPTISTGDTWIVYCNGGPKEVTRLAGRYRDPAPYVLPLNVFTTSCRMIEVVVGKGEHAVTFTVHEPLLTSSSAYFQRALQPAFKEGNTRKIELEDEDPAIFGLLNNYLYTGRLQSPGVTIAQRASMPTLCAVWLLAHYLQIPKLVNHATSCLFKAMQAGNVLAPQDLEEIYERAPLDSKLSKLLLDICVWGPQDFTPSANPPIEMGWDLFAAQKQKSGATKSPLLDVRNYYTGEKELVPVQVGAPGVATQPVAFTFRRK